MSFSLVLNESNLVNINNKSQFEYKFRSGNFKAENLEMCLSQAVVPYSWFNVSSLLNNKTITFKFNDNVAAVVITLPDGFYTIDDINNYLKQQSIINGWYLINGTGDYVYYINIVVNVTYYANQIILNAVPSSLPTGFTAPANFAGFSASGESPSVSFPDGSLYSLVGFPLGTVIPSVIGNQSILSTVTPVGSTVNAIIVRCDFISNDVTTPSDILTSFSINASFGSNINFTPSFPTYLPINNGNYSSFRIGLFDENLNPINAKDGRSLLNLHIKIQS